MKIGHMLGLVVILLASMPLYADCAPGDMVRIETSNQSPGLPKSSFARRAKTLYRAGNRYARTEEALDPNTNTELLVVINAPDVWIANIAEGTGRHIVDPDPQSRARTIIFDANEMGPSFPPEFTGLEFGCEVAFFVEKKAEQVPHEAAGRRLTKHVLDRGTWRLTLLTSTQMPEALLLSKDGKVVFALRYHSYQRFAEIDERLFRPPENVTFSTTE